MKRRNTPKENKQNVKHERDPIPWRYCLLALFCGVLLAVGFFWAARQHFLAMDFGMKNAKLRDQRKALEDEQSRLDVDRENALNPAEIIKRAKKLGLQDLTMENLAIVSPSKVNPENPKAPEKVGKPEPGPKVKKPESFGSEETAKKANPVKDKAGDQKDKARPQIAKK
jgi:hypothetical protein